MTMDSQDITSSNKYTFSSQPFVYKQTATNYLALS